MNKRLMQFISDLLEENEDLQMKLDRELHLTKNLHETIKEQNAQIVILKKKLRTKKEAQK